MIKTEEYKNIPATVVHRLTGKITVADAENGISEAIKIFEGAGQKYRRINLIIDTKSLLFTDLRAHKIWSQWLKASPAIKEKINFVIIVTDDSPNARAEKEVMENEKRKFFFDFDQGIKWLKDEIGI